MKLKLLILTFAIILLAVGTTAIMYGALKVKAVKDYNLHATVVDDFNVAFNMTKSDTDLNFGHVPIGGYSVRRINISNDRDFNVFTEFKLFGELAEWVSIPEPTTIKSGENKQLEFYVYIPEAAEQKDYSGKLRIKLIKI